MEAHGAQPSTVENSRDVMLDLLEGSVFTLSQVHGILAHLKRVPRREMRADLYARLQGVAADVQKVAMALK